MIFKHPCLTHMESDFRNLKCYGFNTSLSSHLSFRLPLEEKNLAFKNKCLIKVPKKLSSLQNQHM